MAFTLGEGLVSAAKTYIEANIAAKLNALDTEYNDGIVLEDPVSPTLLSPRSLRSVQSYPALYILSVSGRFKPNTVTPGATTGQWGDSKPELVIGIAAEDQDPERLEKRLWRYNRAIIELMLDALASPTLLGGWNLIEEWEWDNLTNEWTGSNESSYVSDTTIAMRAFKGETK